jgi:DNA-directed RNA polymerase subunit RPC12/RpoP
MATIKVACPKCGQKVSGDETFYGTKVECPVCSSDILFPGQRREEKATAILEPVPPEHASGDTISHPVPPAEERPVASSLPVATFEESAAPQSAQETLTPASEKTPVEEEEEGPDLPPSPIYGAISIVSAVLSVVTCVGGPLFAPLAIIFGHTALAKARHSPVQPAPGHTLGAIGLMIGYVSLIITLLILLALTFFGDSIREAIRQIWE